MKITDDILNGYGQLGRSKDTWGFTFMIYRSKTKFLISKFNNSYLIYIIQNHLQQNICEESVCIGLVNEIKDLEQLFYAITRGVKLI